MPANSQISRKIVSLARPPFGVISSLRRPAKTAMALRAGDKGFTLVEMLIALFIFAIISIGTTTTMTNSLRGKEKIDQRLEVMQNLETVRAVIKADMSHIILRPSRDILGSQARYKLSGGVTDLIDFTRAGRANPGGLYARQDNKIKYMQHHVHLGHSCPVVRATSQAQGNSLLGFQK